MFFNSLDLKQNSSRLSNDGSGTTRNQSDPSVSNYQTTTDTLSNANNVEYVTSSTQNTRIDHHATAEVQSSILYGSQYHRHSALHHSHHHRTQFSVPPISYYR